MRKTQQLALLLTVAAIATGGQAETLRDALAQAYQTNPTLTAARAQLRSVDENVAVARSARLPQISGQAAFTQTYNGIGTTQSAGRLASAGASASLPIFSGGRIANSIHAADARVMAGRADLRSTEGTVFTTAVTVYMDVIRDTAIVGLNRKQVAVLETNLQATRDRFQVGDLTRTDVAQSEARLSGARSQLAAALGALETSRENYRRVIGVSPVAPETPPPLPQLPATADAATDVALSNNPAIEASNAAAKAAGYDVRTVKGNRLPSVSANAGLTYYNYLGTSPTGVGLGSSAAGSGFGGASSLLGTQNEVKQSTVGVTATVPIYQGGLVGAQVRRARDLEQQSIEQSVETERAVVAQARSAFASFQATAETIRSSEDAVSANQLALEGVRAENSVGNRTILDVLNAEQEYLSSQVSLVSAQHDHYVAGFTLLNAMGRAEMRYLGLDGGPLYDPTANYKSARRRIGDFSDGPVQGQ